MKHVRFSCKSPVVEWQFMCIYLYICLYTVRSLSWGLPRKTLLAFQEMNTLTCGMWCDWCWRLGFGQRLDPCTLSPSLEELALSRHHPTTSLFLVETVEPYIWHKHPLGWLVINKQQHSLGVHGSGHAVSGSENWWSVGLHSCWLSLRQG